MSHFSGEFPVTPGHWLGVQQRGNQMMAVAKKKTGADLQGRLYRWLAKKVPRKKLRKKPSPSLDAHLHQEANIGYEPPFGTLRPVKAVILEVYTADSAKIPTLYVLDLKV